ncbi:MAG: dicarboxylate/amino acid:cation symporter [Synergistetes bacterium]|nr:dicarboxylate/amino acid:cation symporter [Synergistota bacterium]
MVLGTLVGLGMGPAASKLKPFGDIFLNLMFTVVTPVVFITIVSAIINLGGLGKLGRILGSTIFIFIVLGLVASVFMIFILKIFPPVQPGTFQLPKAPEIKSFSLAARMVKTFTVSSFYQLFDKSHMLPMIIFAILLGIAINLVGERGRSLARVFDILSEAMLKLVWIVMLYAPIGIFAYFAALTGTLGTQLLGAYARAAAIYFPAAFVYWVVMYSITSYMAGGMEGLRRWWKNIIPPAITAFGTCSSVATLPVNLDAARRIGVPREVRELVLPIGATIHMDGSCLSGILKIAFLFAVFGKPFSGGYELAMAILIAILGGVALSGVPGGGYAASLIITSVYGFPPEAFPIIAMIGQIVDAPATMVNATGDTNAAMLVSRLLYGKKWLELPSESEEI